MDPLSPLDEMLQQMRSDAQFDSFGQFTVSLQQAISKIRVVSQQEPARWLLYAVQAAVGWKARRVDLSFRPASFAVTLHFTESPPELARESSVLSPAETADRACRDFHNALVWLRALEPKRLDLLYKSPQAGYLLTLAEAAPARAAQPPATESSLTLSVSFRDSAAERVAVYSNQVGLRLSMCPLPVFLDGLRVDCGRFRELDHEGALACRYILPAQASQSRLVAPHPRLQPALSYLVGDSEYERGRRGYPFAVVPRLEIAGPFAGPCLISSQPRPEGLVLAQWQEGDQPVFLCNASQPVVEGSDAELLPCRAYFQRTRESQSSLWVVQRGCRLLGVELSRAPRGWWVALAADSLKTDLSGSQLVMDAALSQSCEWAVEQILNVHQRMAAWAG